MIAALVAPARFYLHHQMIPILCYRKLHEEMV